MGGKQSTATTASKKIITLWKYEPSPPCRAVMMVCDLLKLSVNRIDVNIRLCENASNEFRTRNPLQTVPLIQDDEFIIWDSHVINGYLATTHGGEMADKLYPKDPRKRALVDLRLHFDTGFLFPRFRNSISPILYEDKKCISKSAARSICEAYCVMEIFLCGRPFLTGKEMTIADINCVATVSTLAVLVPISPEVYPRLYNWYCQLSKECFFQTGNMPGLCCFEDKIRKKVFGSCDT